RTAPSRSASVSWRPSSHRWPSSHRSCCSSGARGSRRLPGIVSPWAWPSSLRLQRAGCNRMLWLRRSFIAGFFVTVPLFISVAAFIWIFNVVDGLTTPFYDRLLATRVPGLGIATTVVAIVLVGALATNVIGKRVLQRAEEWL